MDIKCINGTKHSECEYCKYIELDEVNVNHIYESLSSDELEKQIHENVGLNMLYITTISKKDDRVEFLYDLYSCKLRYTELGHEDAFSTLAFKLSSKTYNTTPPEGYDVSGCAAYFYFIFYNVKEKICGLEYEYVENIEEEYDCYLIYSNNTLVGEAYFKRLTDIPNEWILDFIKENIKKESPYYMLK